MLPVTIIVVMDENLSPSIKTFIPTSVILIVIGWGGLIYLFQNSLPTVGPRWLFFFLAVLALTGTVLPAVALLNRRFPSPPPATIGVILRQSLWAGIYFPTLAWLQIGRTLTPTLALLLALGLILIEILLRMRERSRWNP